MPKPPPEGHLLIGPPGSGKTTVASTLAPLLRAQVISNDALREKLWGNANVQGPWDVLEHFLNEAIDNAVAAGENVLVDATHAQLSWRQRLMHRDLGTPQMKWVGWWIQTPLDQCLAWNSSRRRSVPETVIRAMHIGLTSPPDRPDAGEGFRSLIHLNPAGSHLKDQINGALQTIRRHEER